MLYVCLKSVFDTIETTLRQSEVIFIVGHDFDLGRVARPLAPKGKKDTDKRERQKEASHFFTLIDLVIILSPATLNHRIILLLFFSERDNLLSRLSLSLEHYLRLL